MAKKSSKMAPATTKTPGGKSMTQKLSSGSGGKTSGMDLSSKLEGAAKLPYFGHTLSGPVKNGAHGVLAGSGGGGKKLKPPTG